MFLFRVQNLLPLLTLIPSLTACGGSSPPPASTSPKADAKPPTALPVAPTDPQRRACLLDDDADACAIAGAYYDALGEQQIAFGMHPDAPESFLTSCYYYSGPGCEKAGDAVRDGRGAWGQDAKSSQLLYGKACECGNKQACSKAPNAGKPADDASLKSFVQGLFGLSFANHERWKGELLTTAGETLYEWKLPLAGFRMFLQKQNDSTLALIARSNVGDSLTPEFASLLPEVNAQAAGQSAVMDSDAPSSSLKSRLGGPKGIKRIVIVKFLTPTANNAQFTFLESASPAGSYEISITRDP